MKTLLSFILVPTVLLAAEFKSTKALKTKFENGSFFASLDVGYHFNEKAPNGAQVDGKLIKPTELKPQSILISKIPPGKGKVHLYVCDDKVTFCDVHNIELGTEKTKEVKKEKPKTTQREHGFIKDNFEEALAEAQKKNQVVFIDFGARWCPPCVRLEKEIFNTKEFQNLTKDIVKVKIDVDIFANKPLQEKYNIKGYPTLIFTNAQGEEITRFIDYQSNEFFTDIINDIKKDPRSIAEIEKSDNKTNLWKRYYYADQFEKSVPLMETLNPKPKEYWFAKVELAKQQDKTKHIQALKEAIKADPESSRSIAWRASLISLTEKESEKQKIAEESALLTNKLLTSPEAISKSVQTDFVGEYTGFEGFYIAQMNVEAAEEAKYKTDEAWKKVIEQGDKYKITEKDSAASYRLLSAYIQTKDFERADKLVTAMLKTNPKDGDLQRRKMRTLFELKKYKEAIEIGNKALKNSYGVNEFFVVETLAKSYVAIDKKAEAKKLLETYLEKNEINFPTMQGTKKKLEELNKTL